MVVTDSADWHNWGLSSERKEHELHEPSFSSAHLCWHQKWLQPHHILDQWAYCSQVSFLSKRSFSNCSKSVDWTWRTVRKCSSGQPFTIQQQQIDSSSWVQISWHSSAIMEKKELDLRLLIQQHFMMWSMILRENSFTHFSLSIIVDLHIKQPLQQRHMQAILPSNRRVDRGV